MEIKGVVERAEKHHVDKLGKDKWVVLIGGKSYDVWSSRIEQYVGKELPAGCTIKPAPEGTTFNAAIKLPDDPNKGTGKPFVPRGPAPEQIEAMLTSYRKDLMVKAYDVAMFMANMHHDKVTGAELEKEANMYYNSMCGQVFKSK